eukprot:CAMPEP_0119531174 /NCGR_PEP_ID=MMETSP1344-20130328/44910_1 /TAXON_ID=236787 /ORGANISM="Florenciella parvula, Strain CCMP2471" /LENGTH=50 /DNA_ID=CAMNT_0007571349 /DNA_START=21 /DNA_END=170 /DNA_ORIENTATION=+
MNGGGGMADGIGGGAIIRISSSIPEVGWYSPMDNMALDAEDRLVHPLIPL